MASASASPNLETCPVCLTSLANRNRKRKNELGRPESCDHMFCLSCIFEWSKNVNTCPVDRLKFNRIDVFTSLNGSQIRKVHIPDVTLGSSINEDFTYCEICHQCNREDRLLLCDGCDKGYHLDCMAPSLTEVPEGDWYCGTCHAIVQAQYDISMSSPDEESDYVHPYMVADSSDTSSVNVSELSDSSTTVDVTGSGSDLDFDLDLDSAADSDCKIVVDYESELCSDYVDVESCFGILKPSKVTSAGIENSPKDGSFSGLSRFLGATGECVKSEGSTSALPSVATLAGEGNRHPNQCTSEDDEISHRPKRRLQEDIIVISSSEDDCSVLVHRRVPAKRKKSMLSSGSDESRTELIDVIKCSPCRGGSTGRKVGATVPSQDGDKDDEEEEEEEEELNVEMTPSPVTSTPAKWHLGVGPSTCSTSDIDISLSESIPKAQVSMPVLSGGQDKNSVKKRRTGKKKVKLLTRKRKRKSGIGVKRKRATKRQKMRRASGVQRNAENFTSSPVRRGLARTAATHAPRVNVMRQAVKESYRHQDKTEGLEWARAILVSACQSPRGKSRLLESTPASSPGRVDEHKGKAPCEKQASDNECQFDRDASKVTNRTYGFTPNRLEPFRPSQVHSATPTTLFPQRRHSASDSSLNSSQLPSVDERRKAEIQRRVSSNSRSLAHVAISPLTMRTEDDKKRKANSVSSQNAASSTDLVDIHVLCKKLDDLENKCEIKKDGTVVPIRKSQESAWDELTRKVVPVYKRGVSSQQCSGHISLVGEGKREHLGEFSSKDKGARNNGNSVLDFGRSTVLPRSSKHADDCRGNKSSIGQSNNTKATASGALAKQGSLSGYKIPKLTVSDGVGKDKSSAAVNQKEAPVDLKALSLPVSDPMLLNAAPVSHSKQNPKVTQSEKRIEADQPRLEKDKDKECRSKTEKEPTEAHMSSSEASVSSGCNSTCVNNSKSDPRELVRRALDVHFDKGRIKNRQYRRILERATLKIEKHSMDLSAVSESNVRKLVDDYVEAYRNAKFQ